MRAVNTDLFGHELPRWVEHSLMRKFTDTASGASVYLTGLQLAQLRKAKHHCQAVNAQTPMSPDTPRHDVTLLRLFFAHSRRRRYWFPFRGDGVYDVDYSAPYLSCRGIALTRDAASLRALAQHCAAGTAYTLPFWLTAADVSFMLTNLLSEMRVLPLHRGSDAIAHDLADASVSPTVLVQDDEDEMRAAATPRRVMHVERLFCKPLSAVEGRVLFSAFRRFAPVNVRTRRRYARGIADRLRLECMLSKYWCTVWGTLDDFDACGVAPLRGALGVNTFDNLGNPLFLISARCTVDPARAFECAYSDEDIC